MSSTANVTRNAQILRDFYENVWHSSTPAYDEYLAPEAADYRAQIQELKAENPDIHFDLGEIVANGDTVVAVWTTPQMPGVEGISLWHFRDGKITGRTAYTRDTG
jgi:ketosteroid isomerase-like protein